MSILDRFDFSNGDLPPWFEPLVKLTRPMATTMTAMMLPVGAFSVGAVAFFSPVRAINMAKAVEAFLHGIPDPLYWLIGSIVIGYTGAKTVETMRSPRSPLTPTAEQPDVDVAPKGKS